MRGRKNEMIFADREDAGHRLARVLKDRAYAAPVVFALPRGGVAVGYHIARALNAPLDIVVARKLGAPRQPELAIGAIAPGGVVLINSSAVRELRIDLHDVDRIAREESEEMARRVSLYRRESPPTDLRGSTAILVDDGLATGLTAEAAIASLRRREPHKLVLAAPVCAGETEERLRSMVDDVVCLSTPADFQAVGLWYENFDQLTDDLVLSYLDRAAGLASTEDR